MFNIMLLRDTVFKNGLTSCLKRFQCAKDDSQKNSFMERMGGDRVLPHRLV